MKVFFLDGKAAEAAKAHCDKHLSSQIMTTTRLLHTARAGAEAEQIIYDGLTVHAPGYINSAIAVWARSTEGNYVWVAKLGLALLEEYTFRTGKVHRWDKALRELAAVVPIAIPRGTKLVAPPKLVPEDCVQESAVQSYRAAYRKLPQHVLRWTKRDKPEWWAA